MQKWIWSARRTGAQLAADPSLDRGLQRVKMPAVDAMRSAVHVVHRGIELEVDTRASALAPARDGGQNGISETFAVRSMNHKAAIDMATIEPPRITTWR